MLDVEKALNSDGFHPERIVADGKLHRFKRNKDDKGTSAWYVCHQNHSENGEGFYVCVWGDWHEQGNDRKFMSSFTQGKYDKKKIEEQFLKAEKARIAEQERVWNAGAESARVAWETELVDAGASDYLARKGLPGLLGGKTQLDPASGSRAFFVPVCDPAGKIWGLQKIAGDGTKRFSPGTKKHGNFFSVGGAVVDAKTIYLAEGFATAASLHLALGVPVVCSFDAGNLEPVAKVLRAAHKDSAIVICGDTDDTGRDHAERAARAVLGKAVFPSFKSTDTDPSDFNDLHCLEGLDAVRAQVSGVRVKLSKIFKLGHSDGIYYYISTSNQQIRALTSTGHTKSALWDLMPKDFWESQFPAKSGADYDTAASLLMDECRSAGIFHPSMIRGVGVWPEKDGIVVNLGNQMLAKRELVPLNSFPSDYIYSANPKIKPPHALPLDLEECGHLVHAIETLNWKRPEFAKFLAGWLVVAPLAGVLQWRPHVWLTAPAGSGKSWILQTIVKEILGDNLFYFQGSTTEAGIRQHIGSNARPVIFDEFETDDVRSSERVQSVLTLIRQASSESDGVVVKGSAGGDSIQFRVRFACMVASVRVNLTHEPDKTRFTLLELERSDLAHFERVKAALKALAPECGARLFSRSLGLVKTILANQESFQAVLSAKHNSRFGQQYGTLLAGYGSLLASRPLHLPEVEGIVAGLNLSEEAEVTEDRDERECIDYLMSRVIKLDTITWGSNTERSIGELIQQAQADEREMPTLNRIGLKVDPATLYIANSHPYLKKLFQETQWIGGWKKPLSRLPGATSPGVRSFGTIKARCVAIPFKTIFGS